MWFDFGGVALVNSISLLGGRPMVGLQTLDLAIGVRVPASQPKESIDIGSLSPAFPVTPPYMRARIRWFRDLSQYAGGSLHGSPMKSSPLPSSFQASPYPPLASSAEADWLAHFHFMRFVCHYSRSRFRPSSVTGLLCPLLTPATRSTASQQSQS